jgi:Plastocyanin
MIRMAAHPVQFPDDVMRIFRRGRVMIGLVRQMSVFFLLCIPIALSGANALATEYTVSQKGREFSPSDLRVKKGDGVVFVNNDDTTHNVHSTSDGNAFDLKAQRPGATGIITFSTPGSVVVRCAIHPKMTMSVTVE